MSSKNRKGDRLLSQNELLKEYGVTKQIIEKYFPKPIVKQTRNRRGMWNYGRYWRLSEVQLVLEDKVVKEEIRIINAQRNNNRLFEEAKAMLSSYNPESIIAGASELKRVFILHVGPTNSGKTYDAVNSLIKSGCGTYLGPLRLLALEMYDRINAAGIGCTLLTGEEYIPAENEQIVSSTIELCNYKRHYKVAVIDEAQLITDNERGSAWFRAICAVDAEEVHICLAPEALNIIENLLIQFGDPYNVVYHKRLVPLKYSGYCDGFEDVKPGDAIICFSRKNVLSTAALLERYGFRASVIYGALPPEARRNEVNRYVSGETNVIVATDAIGMGISLPIRRVVFAEATKFDGHVQRPLLSAEVRQIAGRAGRFGMFDLGEVLSMDPSQTIEKGMNHQPKSIRAICISFPRDTLDTDYPLEILLKAWQSLPEKNGFLRENMKEALYLNSIIKNLSQGKDRRLVFDLITCPVDTRTQDLVNFWADCARAILRDRRVPKPHFGTETLQDCELQYKAYDIRHQLLTRMGIRDNTEAEREAICERIKELMSQDKSDYIRKCSRCGRELPVGYIYNLCERCYLE